MNDKQFFIMNIMLLVGILIGGAVQYLVMDSSKEIATYICDQNGKDLFKVDGKIATNDFKVACIDRPQTTQANITLEPLGIWSWDDG